MRADSPPADPLRIAMRKVESFRLGPLQAKFVFVTPCCNVWMPAGLDIRIHPDRGRRWLASLSRQPSCLFHQNIEFRFGFGVEKQYSLAYAARTGSIVQRFTNFVPILADSGENNAIAAHADALQ